MIFGFVLSHTHILINFINVKISLQGGAVSIQEGGSGTFDSCSFERNTAYVSTHDNIGFEIECCKFVDCICVVSDLCFSLLKVRYVIQSIKYILREWPRSALFDDFWFCSVAHSMRMSDIFLFVLCFNAVWSIGICSG